jgi:type I restriction enzyme S subunit
MNWTKTKLDKVIDILSGYPFDSDKFTNGEGIPLIRIRDLEKEDTEVNYSGKFQQEYIITKGDLLIGMDGDFNVVLWKGKDSLLNQRVCKVVPRNELELDKMFFYYRIINEIKKINDTVSATTVKHLSTKDIYGLQLLLPKKSEQTRIAQILSKADTAIAQTEALIAKYQRIKTGLMQDLLTKGIDEYGNIRSKATHRFVIKKGMEVSDEWEVKNFNQLLAENIIADIQDGNHGEKHPKGSDFVKEGIPFIMASDISNDEIDLDNCKKITLEQYNSLRIGFAKPEDVLLSHKASIGFVTVIPDGMDEIMLTPQVTYYRIKNKGKLNYKYMSWFMKSEFFQNELSNLSKQSTRDYIGILMQRNLTLAYPKSMSEQLAISKRIESIDNYLKTEKGKLSKLQSLKTGLMHDLLGGKVPVNIKEKTFVN